LLVLGVSFSSGSSLNSYYLAALSPAVAGIVATGALLAWEYRNEALTRLLVFATALITVIYGLMLLPRTGEGVGSWIVPLAVITAVAATVAAWRSRSASARTNALAASGVLCAMLILPSIAALTFVVNGLGAFDTPFEPNGAALAVSDLLGTGTTEAVLPNLEMAQNGAPFLMATQSSAIAGPFIYETGLEVLPIGGFTGLVPSPTLKRLQKLINEDAFHIVLANPDSLDPRLKWIAQNCNTLPSPSGQQATSLTLSAYYCRPGD
jgi:hypothetical protein